MRLKSKVLAAKCMLDRSCKHNLFSTANVLFASTSICKGNSWTVAAVANDSRGPCVSAVTLAITAQNQWANRAIDHYGKGDLWRWAMFKCNSSKGNFFSFFFQIDTEGTWIAYQMSALQVQQNKETKNLKKKIKKPAIAWVIFSLAWYLIRVENRLLGQLLSMWMSWVRF